MAERMGRLTRQPHRPDEPDFVGLTEEEATKLASQRGLQLRLLGDAHGYRMTADGNSGRVTAELVNGVIVYAQRF
jgi:hypothetical protein